MRRIVWLVQLVLYTSACAAQQPDVRVRLLSRYHLAEITVEPVAGASVSIRFTSPRTVGRPFSITAKGKVVAAEGSVASKVTLTGNFRILGERIPPEHINGSVEVSAREDEMWIVAALPVEQYVADVLEGETSGNMPQEALKAMAVTIRSYTTHFRERHKVNAFDFCDSTHCQFLRLDPEATVLSAVTATAGESLWDRGVPLAAYYHKDCGGRTEAVEAAWLGRSSPMLVSHTDPYCVRGAQTWHSEVTRSDLDRVLIANGFNIPAGWNRITVAERTPSGRARTLRFSVGASQGIPVSASSLRFALGRSLGWRTLKSDWYDVRVEGDRFTFSGKGVGHGVGLCQTGAAEMARQGKSYRDILAFYYPGAAIGRSAQGIQWTAVKADDFDLLVMNSGDANVVRSAANSALDWAVKRSALTTHTRPVIEVYPTVAMFRDATGEPGWVAASTRYGVVRLQSPRVLRHRVDGALRHEFLHILVESNAAPNTPLWFREGFVVFVSGDPAAAEEVSMSAAEIDRAIRSRRNDVEMRQAYAEAAAIVRNLERRNGRAKLIDWLRSSLPEGARLFAARPHKVADKAGHE